MNETDELRARIVRLELEIANRQSPAPATSAARGGSVFNTIGSIILIGLCIFGMWAALVIYAPDFLGTSETAFSTPAALPTANITRDAPATRPQPYTTIVEATFPPPAPDVIPTDVPATPPPVYAPAEQVTIANTGPVERTQFTCGIEPGNEANDTCPLNDPGDTVYGLEGRTFVAEPLPTSSTTDNKGFDSSVEYGNQPTPSR